MRTRGLCLVITLHALLLAEAQARTTCQQTPQGPLCISEVDFGAFAQFAYMQQQSSQWCWAASLSMVFSAHGHPINQSRIVSEVYGGLVNLPASGYTIASSLNGCLVDDVGRSFTSTLVAAYDYQAGVNAISNQQIIAALDQGHPLIIGARGHAMVLTAIQYYQTPVGPNVVGAGVFDPWPGKGARALDMSELYPADVGGELMFLALPRITEGCRGGVGGDDDSAEIGCSVVGHAHPLVALMVAISIRRRARASSRK